MQRSDNVESGMTLFLGDNKLGQGMNLLHDLSWQPNIFWVSLNERQTYQKQELSRDALGGICK